MNSLRHILIRLSLTIILLLNSTLFAGSGNLRLFAQDLSATNRANAASLLNGEQALLLHGNVSGAAGSSSVLLVHAIASSGTIRQVAEVGIDGYFHFPPLPRDHYRLRLATIAGEPIPLRADSDTQILPDSADRSLHLVVEDGALSNASVQHTDQSLVALPEADPSITYDPLSQALAAERDQAAELEMQFEAAQMAKIEEEILPQSEIGEELTTQSSMLFLPVISNDITAIQAVEETQIVTNDNQQIVAENSTENPTLSQDSVLPSTAYAVAAGNGKISGRVTDANSGTGVANVGISARELNFHDSGYATTNASGYYTISGLINGSYSVEFDPPFGSELQGEYYNNQRQSASANPVSVTEDNLTPNINAVMETGARIAGRVTAADSGAGLGNLYVYLYRSSGGFVSSVYIQSGGYYTFSGLSADGYTILFNAPSGTEYIEEYYNDKHSSDDATPITVTLNTTTTNINGALEKGGRVTGRVTDAVSGVGIANVNVTLDRTNGVYESSVSTASGGYYTFTKLAPNAYHVFFRAPFGTEYLDEYYNNKRTEAEATPITVTFATTVTNVNAGLETGGRLTGRVTGTTNGEGLANAHVTLYDGDNSFASSQTDPSGYYTFTNLSAGSIKVKFTPPFNTDFVEEYYNKKRSLTDATPVTIRFNTTTTNISGVLDVGGRITGRVTDAVTGSPIPNIYLSARGNTTRASASATTDNAGYYTLTNLLADSYKIQSLPPFNSEYLGEYYNGKAESEQADPVNVVLNQTTTAINFTLDRTGRVLGRVTNKNDQALAAIKVSIRKDAQFFDDASTYTDANGNYTFTRLSESNYTVRFEAPSESDYVDEYYNNQRDLSQAARISITTNSTVNNINAQLEVGGKIKGRVTDPAGKAVADVYVYADATTPNTSGLAYTDANGYYTITRLLADDYTVLFLPPSKTELAREYYNNQHDFNQAQLIAVDFGTLTTGIDAQLEVGGKITGRVINKAGAGVKNIDVRLQDNINSFATNDLTRSDNAGYYTFTSLLTGAYYVSFEPSSSDYIAEYYDNQRSIERARAVTVTLGQVTPNINASLELGGKIIGKITSSDGAPLEDVFVYVYNSLDQRYSTRIAQTDSAGQYTATGLYYGQYYLYFDVRDSVHVAEYYDNAQEMPLAKPVKVAIDTVVSGIDAQLAKGSSVTGRVTNTQGEGLPRVMVNAYASLTDEYPNATTTTDNSGYYTLTSLAAGAYFIKFTPGFYDYNTEYARQYYNDKTHRRVANVVTVAANSVVPNINAVLKPHPGEIRGRVTDATGKGLEDVFVYAYYNQVEAGVASTKSDVNGVYTLTRLSPGSYYLYFDARQGSYLDESYNNQRNFSDAEPVTVAASTPTQNINATLEKGGTITGQILLADGTPAIDAEITVEAKPGIGFVLERTTTTDASGKYTITALLAGSYSVYVAPALDNKDYQAEYYNDKTNAASADAVTVSLNGVTANINLVLNKRGAISGRVTDSAGKPLQSVSVQLSIDRYNTFYTSTRSDAQGVYTITDLSSGTYYLYFDATSTSNLQSEYYNNQHIATAAAAINVTSGVTVTNIDAALEQAGSITGKVTAADTNLPLSYVSVYAYGKDDCGEYGFIRSTSADASGIYTMTGLAAGTYDVYFSPYSYQADYLYQYQNDVSVAVGATTANVNAALQRGGRIGGRILAADSNFPLSEVRAIFYRTLSDGSLTWEGSDTTDIDGYYRSNGLVTGSYKVFFDVYAGNTSSAYLDEIYNGKELLSSGDLVTVSNGNTTNLVDVSLTRGGQIAGTLIDEVTLAPLSDVDIYIYGSNSATFPVATTFTRNGTYLTQGLPAGSYYVRFRTTNTTDQEYIEEYYKDTATLATASAVTVNAGSITSGINGELTVGATISGRVTLQTTGEGISAVSVVADGNGAGYGSTNPDSDGYYTIYGLASDSYKVGFYGTRDDRRCGYIQYSTSFYNGKSRLEDAELLTLAAPNRNNPALHGAASEAVPSVLNNINAILTSSDVVSVATPTPTITPGGPTLTPTPTITPGGPTLTPTPTPIGQKSVYLPVVSR